jgi:hypothetical protein
MDTGEQPVNGSHIRGQLAGFFGGGEGFGNSLLDNENKAKLLVTAPEIGTELNSLANDAFGVRI